MKQTYSNLLYFAIWICHFFSTSEMPTANLVQSFIFPHESSCFFSLSFAERNEMNPNRKCLFHLLLILSFRL